MLPEQLAGVVTLATAFCVITTAPAARLHTASNVSGIHEAIHRSSSFAKTKEEVIHCKDDAAAAVMSFNLPPTRTDLRTTQTDSPTLVGRDMQESLSPVFWTAVPDFLAGSSMGDLLSRAARPTCVLMRITQR